MPSPLYSGEQYATPSVSTVQLPTKSPFADLFAAARRAGIAAADDLDNALQKRYDDGLEFTRAARTRQVEADARDEIIRRSALEAGNPDSFWNADGTYRKEVVRDLMHRVTASLQGLDKGFISPDAQQTAFEAQDKAIFGIQAMMQSTIARQVSERTRRAYEDARKLALEQHDFDAVRALDARAESSGSISPAERKTRDIITTRNEHTFVVDHFHQRGDLDALQSMYDEQQSLPDNDPEKMTPDQLTHLSRCIDDISRRRTLLTLKPFSTVKGKTPAQSDPLATLRDGLPAEYLALYQQCNGQFNPKENPANVQKAEQLASLIATRMMTTPGDAVEAQNFKEAMEALGVSSDYLNKVIKTRQDFLTKATTFDPKEVFDTIPKYNFFQSSNVDRIDGFKRDLATVDAEIANALRAGDNPDDELKNRREALVKDIARWEHYEKEERDKAWTHINSEYAEWYRKQMETSEKGAPPSPRDCSTAFFDITNKYLEKVDRSFAANYTTHRSQQLSAYWNKLEQERKLAAESVRVADEYRRQASEASPTYAPVSEQEFAENAQTVCITPSLYDTTAASLPHSHDKPLIYVPRNHPSADQLITIRENSPRKNTMQVQCIPEDGIEYPIPSLCLLRKLTGSSAPQDYNTLSLLRDRAELYYSPYWDDGIVDEDDSAEPQGEISESNTEPQGEISESNTEPQDEISENNTEPQGEYAKNNYLLPEDDPNNP